MTEGNPSRGELLHNFVDIAWFAIRRVVSYRDLEYVFLLLVAPILHLLRFKSELKTPVGRLKIEDNNVLRWSIYGLIKTKFGYLRMLESAALRNLPKSTIVDVGANLGDFSMAISAKAKRVISIEPGRENFLRLCSNLRANSLNQVTPLNMAAHDRSETLSLTGNGADLAVSRFNGGEHTIGIRLDNVLSDHKVDHVDVLKIDVQGHESKVLHGLTESLKGHRVGLAIVEIHPHKNIKATDVVNLMQSFGYHLTATDYLFGRPQLYFEFA